uniref:Cytochrome c oxidase subunit 2 n=1 Tax=Songthela hangzhouensis TaxID=1649374 RepID=Q6JT43_9ARAC|nr:cytochrome c oxidase subunit II [Songthela hangzhouensis]AAP51135.1 cytochrome c oxidase subunit II [Songthela hangzhouensis]
MPTWMNLSFQDSASPLMEQLYFFHDHTMIILIMITILAGYILMNIIFTPYFNRYMLEGQELESFWTLIPALLLIFIALPSLRTLYLMDENLSPEITLKVSGFQWYWVYEFSDFKKTEIESFLSPLKDSSIRLLEVDNPIPLPLFSQIRVIVSSNDVIHSWAVPSMGVKVDALPGRLNQTSIFTSRVGKFSGQCSEICGANHSFMPISIEVVPQSNFISWLFI